MRDPMDVVRAFFRAVNDADAAAIAAFYHPDCCVEHVFAGDQAVYAGAAAVHAKWSTECTEYSGALPGGARVEPIRIAGIETGWGWVRAEWVSGLHRRATGEERHAAGHSHFWIEDGLIRRHRSVETSLSSASGTLLPSPASARMYPSRPIVGVGAVIVMADRRVVLVKRTREPLAGQWSLPGGTLELGESLEAGTAREIREETGLVVDVGPLIELFDRILLDDEGRVRYHFVLADYLCRPLAGTLAAGSDVSDVTLADPAALDRYLLADKAHDVIARALTMIT